MWTRKRTLTLNSRALFTAPNPLEKPSETSMSQAKPCRSLPELYVAIPKQFTRTLQQRLLTSPRTRMPIIFLCFVPSISGRSFLHLSRSSLLMGPERLGNWVPAKGPWNLLSSERNRILHYIFTVTCQVKLLSSKPD